MLETETIGGVTYKYAYDTLGNITDIYRKDGTAFKSIYQYEYDAMNQLTYVYDVENKTAYSYNYDTGGNLICETVNKLGSNGIPVSTTYNRYTYGDSNWTDKLTSYNGQTITYDAIGNPLSYRGGIAMTWKNGRQLATLSNDNHSVSYSYDSNSVRVSKTVDGEKYTYEYLDGMLLYETRGEAKFWYSYDSNGMLYNIRYTLSDDGEIMSYYCTHNSRGDIIGIYNGDGVLRAQYEYDSWGNVLSVTDENGNAIASATHVGNLNPFRYRGYYYDTESGFYYLMSRYYDPVTHRFINADGYFQAGNGILDANMSAYCRNNPIMYSDQNGMFVFYYSYYGDATFGLGAYGSINFVFDDKGNTAIQYTYIDYSENGYSGVMDASAGASLNFIWDADTVYDLEQDTVNIGASGGYELSLGLDLIELNKSNNIGGISISGGVGIGVDVHEYTSTTKTLWSNNANPTSQTSNYSKPTTKKISNSNQSSKGSSKQKTKPRFKVCPICGCPHIPIK